MKKIPIFIIKLFLAIILLALISSTDEFIELYKSYNEKTNEENIDENKICTETTTNTENKTPELDSNELQSLIISYNFYINYFDYFEENYKDTPSWYKTLSKKIFCDINTRLAFTHNVITIDQSAVNNSYGQ